LNCLAINFYFYFFNLLAKKKMLFLSADNKILVGSVAVANIAFNKLVVARFTLDYWKTTSEVVAEYNNDVRQPKHADGRDRFNFNIKLARDQNPNMKFGISLLPGMEPGSSASFIGGDLVVVPKGSKRVNDAVDFMKFILSDEVQVEGYAKLLNLTTRADMVDNKYFKAEPLVQDVAKALSVGKTPYTLTFFEQINSPQGPWLQMLQRAYYTDDPIDQIIKDAKAQMKTIAAQ